MHDLERLRVHGLAGHDVRAVAVERDEQLDQAVLERAPRVVAQPQVVAADVGRERGQPVHLRVQGPVDDLPLGLLGHRRRTRRTCRPSAGA